MLVKKRFFVIKQYFIYSNAFLIAMEKELRFAIREGGRTVGAGVVAEIIA